MRRTSFREFFIILAVILLLAATTLGNTFEKKSRIELQMGLWKGNDGVSTEINSGSVNVTADKVGLIGGLGYGFWMQENLAIMLSLSVLAGSVNTEANIDGVYSETVGVIPMLAGVRYYPFKIPGGSNLRPYFSLGIGPYFGFHSENQVGRSITESSQMLTTFGTRLGGGVDFRLNDKFMAALSLGYNFIGDFIEPLGGNCNHSCPELSLGISFLIGKGSGTPMWCSK